jgi:hypothetical protein
MESRIAYFDVLFEKLPALKQYMKQFDDSAGRIFKRHRGDRTKLNGGVILEEVAVDWVKIRKKQLREDGIFTFDAETKARQEIAKVLGVSPATLEDWYRGVQRRERRKPSDQRRHSRRKQKRDQSPNRT